MKKAQVLTTIAATSMSALALAPALPVSAATTQQIMAKNPTKGPGYYATGETFTSQRSVVTIHYIPGYKIAVWANPAGHVTGKYLPHGSRWKTSGYAMVNGNKWYNLGGNQWIDAKYTSNNQTMTTPQTNTSNVSNIKNTTGTLRVTYRTGIVVWATPGARPTGKYLPTGSHWKFFKTSQLNGETWYNLGGNQWIPAKYISTNTNSNPTATTHNQAAKSERGISTINAMSGNGTYVYSSPVSTSRTKQFLPNGSRWKYFSSVNNGILWLQVGRNQWIQAADAH